MGAMTSVITQMFPGQPTWTGKDVPDLSGKVILVTGGNSGVGKETVKVLLQKNAKVYLAARSVQKAQAAIEDLKAKTGREAIFLELDLSSLNSVRASAAKFLSLEQELHVLFLNAGVAWTPKEMLTVDGFDMQLGTNVVGHWLFMELLIPVLSAGARTSSDRHSRIVWTSSSGAYVGVHDLAVYRPGPARDKRSPSDIYADSKLGNALVAREAARRYTDRNIVVTSVNPGNIQTNLDRNFSPFARWMVSYIVFPPEYGPLVQLYAGTSPEALSANGQFFIPWGQVGKMPRGAQNATHCKELWEWLEQNPRESRNTSTVWNPH